VFYVVYKVSVDEVALFMHYFHYYVLILLGGWICLHGVLD